MTEKSHVGMSLCFFCGEPKDILLDRRLKNTLVKEACYDRVPCPKCKDLMKKGVMMIQVDESKTTDKSNPYKTGPMVVITKEAFARFHIEPQELKDRILERGLTFIPVDAWEKLGLPSGEELEKEANKCKK